MKKILLLFIFFCLLSQSWGQEKKLIYYEIKIDQEGKFDYMMNHWLGGYTIEGYFWIKSPDATYTVTMKSDQGGGGCWENIPAGKVCSFKLKTAFWSRTVICFNVISSNPNSLMELGLAYIKK